MAFCWRPRSPAAPCKPCSKTPIFRRSVFPTILKAMAFAPQGLPRISEWKKKIGKIPSSAEATSLNGLSKIVQA
jgi:hypothetical protein